MRYNLSMELLKLPHLDRGRQRVKVRELESGVQGRIMQALGMLGYIVIDTTRKTKKQKCPKCGNVFWQQEGSGTTKGLPDILVTRAGWPIMVGLEIKTDEGKPSEEQQMLIDLGVMFLVRGHEEAIEILKSTEKRFGLPGRGA